MESGQRVRQAFRVAREAPKARSPCEAALDHPASRQQHETAFGPGVLDHLLLNAVALCCLTSRFAGIALIHVRKRHALAGHFLYRMGQLLDLCAILLIGRCHMQCQQLTQSIDRETVTLFVTIGDDDGADAPENEFAEVLNPPTVFNRFITRYE